MYRFLQRSLEREFETVSCLKESDRGSVKVLRHRGTGRRYILRSFSGSDQVYRKLLGVKCPHLPRIFEAWEEEGKVLVLEEYIQGDPLSQLLKGGLFTPAEARPVIDQLCVALWVLHGLGAVHRDVKADNVILRSGGAVLIDFDASRIFKDSSRADTQVLGTVGYAPPEQYGIGQTDQRSDIYALGVLLNLMLTGEHPSTALAPGRLGRVVRKCTMISPESRYPSVAALREAL